MNAHLPPALAAALNPFALSAERRAQEAQERLEREAQAGRDVLQRLDALMYRCRHEHHQLTYADLVALGR